MSCGRRGRGLAHTPDGGPMRRAPDESAGRQVSVDGLLLKMPLLLLAYGGRVHGLRLRRLRHRDLNLGADRHQKPLRAVVAAAVVVVLRVRHDGRGPPARRRRRPARVVGHNGGRRGRGQRAHAVRSTVAVIGVGVAFERSGARTDAARPEVAALVGRAQRLRVERALLLLGPVRRDGRSRVSGRRTALVDVVINAIAMVVVDERGFDDRLAVVVVRPVVVDSRGRTAISSGLAVLVVVLMVIAATAGEYGRRQQTPYGASFLLLNAIRTI